jgi:hypothetical protein
MIDYTGLDVKGRVELFDATHGLNAVVSNGWLLFADGAMRETNPFGPLCEPPDDPWKCAKLIVRYHEIKYQLATEQFTNFKNSLLMQTKTALRDGSPPPAQTEEAVTTLKALREKVLAMQKNLEQARQECDAAKPAYMRDREKQKAENKGHNAQLVSAIEQVTI